MFGCCPRRLQTGGVLLHLHLHTWTVDRRASVCSGNCHLLQTVSWREHCLLGTSGAEGSAKPVSNMAKIVVIHLGSNQTEETLRAGFVFT